MSFFDWQPEDKAWVYQERLKGGWETSVVPGVDSHGGWGINPAYKDTPIAEASGYPDSVLRTNSIFKPFNIPGIYGEDGGTVAACPQVQAKLLAEAIPALSRAAGSNPIDRSPEDGNFDLNVQGKRGDIGTANWPVEGHELSSRRGKWLHFDFRQVAYYYTCHFYDNLVSKGDLK